VCVWLFYVVCMMIMLGVCERERERESVCVCVWLFYVVYMMIMLCLRVCVCERERVCVCMRARESVCV